MCVLSPQNFASRHEMAKVARALLVLSSSVRWLHARHDQLNTLQYPPTMKGVLPLYTKSTQRLPAVKYCIACPAPARKGFFFRRILYNTERLWHFLNGFLFFFGLHLVPIVLGEAARHGRGWGISFEDYYYIFRATNYEWKYYGNVKLL